MTLSIRARLTAWYAAVVVVAFAAGAVVIAQVQARVALNRLDQELARLQHTVTAVLHNEFGEGLDLSGAVKVLHLRWLERTAVSNPTTYSRAARGYRPKLR